MKEFYMAEALKEAKIAYDENEIPIGAVVVFNGEIIGRGHNQKEFYKDSTYHAEIIALREAAKIIGDWRLNECDLYVTLEPCSMCAGAILNARIRRVYVGTRDLRMGACGTAIDLLNVESFNHKIEVEFGILEEESRNILSEFFKKLRNK